MAIELAGCMGVCLWPMFVYSMRDGYRTGWLHGGYVCGLCLCTVSPEPVSINKQWGGGQPGVLVIQLYNHTISIIPAT